MKHSSDEFIALYDQYSDSVYRFILFKVSNKDTAWDLTQDCFTKAWEYWSGARGTVANPKAFLFTVARNLVIDHWRARGRAQVISIEEHEIDMQDTRSNDAHTQSVMGDEARQVLSLLSRLPEADRELLTLRFTEELSFSEIAKITGKSAIALRVQVHRAIRKLKGMTQQ